MSPRREAVHVAIGYLGTVGRSAFVDSRLVAVLVLLLDPHADEAGMQFLEEVFGLVNTATPPTFADLDAAWNWTEQRLSVSWRRSAAPIHVSGWHRVP